MSENVKLSTSAVDRTCPLEDPGLGVLLEEGEDLSLELGGQLVAGPGYVEQLLQRAGQPDALLVFAAHHLLHYLGGTAQHSTAQHSTAER